MCVTIGNLPYTDDAKCISSVLAGFYFKFIGVRKNGKFTNIEGSSTKINGVGKHDESLGSCQGISVIEDWSALENRTSSAESLACRADASQR